MNILAIVLIVSGAMFGLCALCFAIACKSDPKVFKISLIVTLICVALLIIGIIISSASNNGEVYVNGELRKTEKKIVSSNSGSKTCSVCGKSYSSGGTSNMCSQCYKNYKYASDAADKARDY